MIELAVALFLIGLGLIVAEVMIPSFGLLTLTSAACLIGGTVIAFGESNTAGFVFVGAAFVLIPVTILIGFKALPHTRIGKKLTLTAPDTPQAVASIYEDNRRLMGCHGAAVTSLRPSGTADFDGERVSVVTEGEMLDQGCQIRVIEVEGNRIVVRPLDDAPDKQD